MLEINKNHRKISGQPKNLLLFSTFEKLVSGILVGVTLFSPQINKAEALTIDANVPNSSNSSYVSEYHKDFLYLYSDYDIENLTEDDYEYVTSITIVNGNGAKISSLEFLNKFKNLKDLYFYCSTEEQLDLFKSVSNYVFPSVTSFGVTFMPIISTVNLNTVDAVSIIRKSAPNVTSLELNGCLVAPEELSSFEGLTELTIGHITENSDIDFINLPQSVKTINIECEPYDAAVFFNSKEYNSLINRGVKINFASQSDKDTYLRINDKLDSIVENELKSVKNGTDQEKLDAILIYVLEHLNYDKEVSELLRNNEDASSVSRSFYTGGKLYGALEKDSAICGNYSALTEALMDRLGVSSTLISANNHEWNLVQIDGEYYYVDATWLDDVTGSIQNTTSGYNSDGSYYTSYDIKFTDSAEVLKNNGDKESLDWYMEDPNEINDIDRDGTHNTSNIPYYMDFTNISPVLDENDISEDIVEQGDTKVGVKVGNKKLIVAAGALVGVMVSLGVAIPVYLTKRRRKGRHF